ncbi:hypothetical protein ACYFX5_11095 [Bremerella sp. T1]|uniref:hypothetical protein n=1 Tax=Bremerella sp. TYQ1 TaxID=3119568 RepID=UPI001CCFE3F3|nr:hypothetical protein [Bremerella volcania]UBM38794.1 hypothetical protein LA756_13040 [Bremerella volcania]
MKAKFIRIFRTSSSERFLLHDLTGEEMGMLDLHFLADGTVAGNLFLVASKVTDETGIRVLLEQIDEQLVPAASMEDANLSFTVTQGELVGTFSSEED